MTDSLLKTGRGIPAHEKCFAAGCHNDSGWMGGVLCKQHYDQLPPNMTHGTDELTTLRDALTTMTVERDSLQSCLDKMYGIRNHLESALTASEKRINEAAEIIEGGCSSGYIPGCDADTKWQERRTAWLAKGETK